MSQNMAFLVISFFKTSRKIFLPSSEYGLEEIFQFTLFLTVGYFLIARFLPKKTLDSSRAVWSVSPVPLLYFTPYQRGLALF